MIAEFFSENSFITRFFLQSTVCIAVGLAGSLALRHRAARAHQILLLTIIMAIALPVISIVVKHYELGMFEANQVLNAASLTQMTAQHYDYDEALPPSTVEAIPYSANVTEARSPSLPIHESKRMTLTYQRVLVWGWIVTTLVLTIRLVVTFMLGLRLLRQAKPVRSQKIKKAMLAAKEKIGFEKDVRLLGSNSVPSPVIWGWKRQPVMLLQSGAETIGDHVDWVSLFCHELAHCKRRDHISELITELAVCFLPWQPLLWWAKSRLIALSEQACDDWVVASGSQVTDYAESLLDLVPQGRMAFAPAVVSSKKGLAGRVRRILKDGCGEPRTGVVWGLAVTAIVTCLAIGAAFAQTRPAKATQPKEAKSGEVHVLHFPKGRSLGRLMIEAESPEGTSSPFAFSFEAVKWESLSPAQGDVKIPLGKRVCLILNSWTWENPNNLSVLKQLKPDDIYSLTLSHQWSPGRRRPSDKCMPYVAHLTGLKTLNLQSANITSRGLEYLTKIKSLERLFLPAGITDSGMVTVAKLKSLKVLHFGQDNYVTNKGLVQLTSLVALEELALRTVHMTDQGLQVLSGLPRLRHLMLAGNFTNDAFLYLKDVSSLRTLSVEGDIIVKRFNDRGMENVSRLNQLENFAAYFAEGITNRGIAYLKNMPSLKKLNIGRAKITDKAMADLAQISSLEYLVLPHEGISDVGLSHLASLTRLRHLVVARIHYTDPSDNKGYYTDKGIRELSNLHSLEYLMIGSIGVTDEGMSHIAKLPTLKKLMLFGCDNVTDKGLAKLAGLKSLTSLEISYVDITVFGLAQLNSLSNLKRLKVRYLRRDGAILDLSGLTNLEDLTLGFSRKSDDAFVDADLMCLRNLEKLKWLQIGPLNFTDAGMAYLAGLTNMERLNIGGSKLTDNGLKYLDQMKKLNHLTITNGLFDRKKGHFGSGGNITDEGLRHLSQIKPLGYLNITADKDFSPAAIRQLRQELSQLNSLEINGKRIVPTSYGGVGYGMGASGR